MSTETGATLPETDQTNGGVDSTKTGAGSGVGTGQTGVSQEEFQKALSEQASSFKKEIASRDAKLSELLNADKQSQETKLSLDSLSKELKQERVARIRSDFARKNNVPDELLGFLSGSSNDELSTEWERLSGVVESRAEAKLTANHQKLGNIPAGGENTKPETEDEIFKRVFGASSR